MADTLKNSKPQNIEEKQGIFRECRIIQWECRKVKCEILNQK